MKNTEIRLLRADEIECRVGTINERGLSLLLYKDARVDQKILDEAFGMYGWERTHQSIEGNLYCTVRIWDSEKAQWIEKQDVGTTSYTEKEKGQASDAFKRACVNVGIGRELYTAPFIWISSSKANIQKRDNRYTTSERFQVREISYNGMREIAAITIVNDRGVVVYEYQEKKNSSKNQNTTNRITELQKKELENELKRTGVDIEKVLGRYELKKLDEMTPDIYERAIHGLKNSKSKDRKAA
ncbi:Rad52/Rad22 family DNA repair protein [Dorea formicigenerans]|uniref:Uncharacterized protein n=1 Tax=Dorea formicigenerans TaxID=39486 RepID=A0A412MBY3_9FIRM|nr:Rad52/Rad22 family DNA repair protein [Dorea formicigenerans]RGT07437.1 hypothetical protein DWX53_12580 [Dorea formicigenerans]RHE26518.1 hypothetical protein DW756_11900 [Dorea formicigenerans]